MAYFWCRTDGREAGRKQGSEGEGEPEGKGSDSEPFYKGVFEAWVDKSNSQKDCRISLHHEIAPRPRWAAHGSNITYDRQHTSKQLKQKVKYCSLQTSQRVIEPERKHRMKHTGIRLKTIKATIRPKLACRLRAEPANAHGKQGRALQHLAGWMTHGHSSRGFTPLTALVQDGSLSMSEAVSSVMLFIVLNVYLC